MTRPGIEPRSPGPLANTQLIRPMARLLYFNPRFSKNIFLFSRNSKILTVNILLYFVILYETFDNMKSGLKDSRTI